MRNEQSSILPPKLIQMADNAMSFVLVGTAELISKWLIITKVAVSEFALVSRELCRKSHNIDHARSYPAAEG
jgi:hypothetical protein